MSSVESPPRDLDLAIVILNYNTVDLLRDCLRSLFAGDTSLRYHVCVVDNASTDGSAAMVQTEFPGVHLIENRINRGFSSGNNDGLRWYGFGVEDAARRARYALLLNPDTLVPPTALAAMVRFMDARPEIGVAGPRVRRLDGSLDRACRRSFPTPQVSFYRMVGLSKLFPTSRRFNAYNLGFYAEDAVHPVDSVVGAFMLLRREAIAQVGLLDEAFFMYGEDLDWAKRMKDAGWEVWYNGQVEITHVKEAASRQSAKSRIDFHEASWIFYEKHYRQKTNWWVDKAILLGIVVQGGVDVARHLWEFTRRGSGGGTSSLPQRKHISGSTTANVSTPAPTQPSLQMRTDRSS
ncbi:MAG: glycosyltransferase family 2 protein [Caldilineaceae bacterium]|nr:glycosyltransferase family 2 protein [Caldilineaceae bacterium]